MRAYLQANAGTGERRWMRRSPFVPNKKQKSQLIFQLKLLFARRKATFTLHSALCTLHFAFCALHSALTKPESNCSTWNKDKLIAYLHIQNNITLLKINESGLLSLIFLFFD
jgi:hypothetical protein